MTATDHKPLVLTLLLLCLAAVPATATVYWTVDTVGSEKVYTYTFTNTEEQTAPVLGFHVYAPTDVSVISGHSAPSGWSFGTAPDISGALDIFWIIDSPADYLYNGDSATLQLLTSAEVATSYDYALPDFTIGNWAYDAEDMGLVWTLTMFGKVPVPEGAAPVVPEPCSAIGLSAALVGLLLRRRSRTR